MIWFIAEQLTWSLASGVNFGLWHNNVNAGIWMFGIVFCAFRVFRKEWL